MTSTETENKRWRSSFSSEAAPTGRRSLFGVCLKINVRAGLGARPSLRRAGCFFKECLLENWDGRHFFRGVGVEKRGGHGGPPIHLFGNRAVDSLRSLRLARICSAALMVAMPWSSARPQSANEMGLVLTAKGPSKAPTAAAAFSRFIDQTEGRSSTDLVKLALERNGELAAARDTVAEARGRLRQAGLRPNPMIETSGTHALAGTDNNLMIGAELPLELGGRRKARIAVAQREIEMREAEIADFERKLAAEVRMKYAEAVAAARNLRYIEDLLNLTRDSYRLIQARVDRGKSAPLEQNIVNVEVARVDVMRIGFESRAEIAMLELKKTIGLDPAEPLRLTEELDSIRQPSPQADGARTALTSRPDIVAARAAESLAAARIEQARVEGKVDASIFTSYERMRFGIDLRGLDRNGALVPIDQVFHYVTGGVKLVLPVRNRNQGNIEAAVAAQQAARRRREFAEVAVRNEVAAAYSRYAGALSALALYHGGVRGQAMKNLDVIRQTYVLGQKSVLDYVAEQRRFNEIESAYNELLKDAFISSVEIGRAVGTK